MLRRLIAMLAALIAGATSASAAPNPSYGVNGTSSILLAPSATARRAAIADLARIGARYVRIDVTWTFVEPMPGAFNWPYYDAVVSDIRARGLEPILLLDYGNPAYGPTTRPADFARYARAVAARYAPRGCHTFEVWNEPNHPAHYLSPGDFVALLAASRAAIHTADPSAIVISGGLAPSGAVSYAQAMYAAGAHGTFDAFGLHPYVGEGTDAQQPIRDLMVANGDGAKKMWATEAGWSTWDTPGNSEELQASRFTQMVGWWREVPGWGPFIAYTHRDTGTDPLNAEQHFGLLRFDGSRKPAWTTFRGLVRAG